MSHHSSTTARNRLRSLVPTFPNSLRGNAIRVLKRLANKLNGLAESMGGVGTSYGLNTETEAAGRFLNKPGSIFFDIGANIGAYTKSLLSNPAISSNLKELHLFEPSAKTFAVLKDNISDSRARCVNKGV